MEADPKGGKVLSTGRPFDYAQGDEQSVGGHVRENILSIPAQTNTSFVPYITSVSKQCIQPMGAVARMMTLLIFVSMCLLNSAHAQSRPDVGAADGQRELKFPYKLEGKIKTLYTDLPVEGARIRTLYGETAYADNDGVFELFTTSPDGTLKITASGFEPLHV